MPLVQKPRIYAVLMVLALWCFVLPSVFRGFLVYDNVSTYFLLTPKTLLTQQIDFGIYATLIFVLFFGYYKIVNNFDFSDSAVKIWCLMMAGSAIFISSTSTDVYDYIAQGRLQAQYGLNPYLSTRTAVTGWQNDPLLNTPAWHTPSIYGPLWLVLSRLLSSCGGGSLLAHVFLLKLLFALLHLINTVLIYKIGQALHRGRPSLMAGVYALNPLIILELIGGGHNDMLMLTFLILGLYSAASKKLFWVLPSFGLSLCVKHTSILLALPLFIWLYKQYKETISRLLLSLLVAIVEIVILYGPYWEGRKIFDSLLFWQQKHSAASLHYFLTHFFEAPSSVSWGLVAIFLIAYLWITVSLSARPKSDDAGFTYLTKACSVTLLFFYCFGLKWWQSWYVSWVLPFVLFLNPKDPRLRLVISMSSFSLIGAGLSLMWGYMNDFQYGFFLFSFVVPIVSLLVFKRLYPKSDWNTIVPPA